MAKRAKRIPKPKPCPCCGESGESRGNEKYDGDKEGWDNRPALGLDVGQTSADSYGVICYTCGLRVSRTWPYEFLEGRTMKQIDHECLLRAVEAWNRRDG